MRLIAYGRVQDSTDRGAVELVPLPAEHLEATAATNISVAQSAILSQSAVFAAVTKAGMLNAGTTPTSVASTFANMVQQQGDSTASVTMDQARCRDVKSAIVNAAALDIAASYVLSCALISPQHIVAFCNARGK